MSNGAGRANVPDKIRALRLWLHRRLDRLYDTACDPAFTGSVKIDLSAKEGRPGEPRIIIEEYGARSEP